MVDPKGAEAIKVMAQEKACEQGMGRWLTSSLNEGRWGSVGRQTRLVPCSPRRPGFVFGPFSQAPCRPPGSSSCFPTGPSCLISKPTQILTKACKKHSSQGLIKSHTGAQEGVNLVFRQVSNDVGNEQKLKKFSQNEKTLGGREGTTGLLW